MTSRPWMPLYVAEYLADTGHFSAVEHGAYLLLIMHYWSTGGLPNNDQLLARICKLTPSQWMKARDLIAPLFQEGWKHKRIEFELTEVARLSAAGRTGGKASGEARRQRSSNDKPTIVQRTTNDQANDLATKREALTLTLTPSEEQERCSSSGPRKRGSRLEKDWWPTNENVEYALSKGISIDRINTEAEKFRNYWTAKAGKDAAKMDWDATWQNWILKASESGKGHVNGSDRRPGESLGSLGRRLAAEARDLERAQGIGRPDDSFGSDRSGDADS